MWCCLVFGTCASLCSKQVIHLKTKETFYLLKLINLNHKNKQQLSVVEYGLLCRSAATSNNNKHIPERGNAIWKSLS